MDLRGHADSPNEPRRFLDDRVGIGPGDALVVAAPSELRGLAPDGSTTGDQDYDPLLSVLLSRGKELTRSDRSVTEGVDGADPLPLFIIRAPEFAHPSPGHARAWLAEVVGVDEPDLQLPGHAQGDDLADLWSHPPAPPRVAHFALPQEPLRVSELRRLLGRLLASWRLDGRVNADDVRLLATEIATKATKHTDSDAVCVVRYTGPLVRVEVTDSNPHHPVVLQPSSDRDGGEGAAACGWSTAWRTTGEPSNGPMARRCGSRWRSRRRSTCDANSSARSLSRSA